MSDNNDTNAIYWHGSASELATEIQNQNQSNSLLPLLLQLVRQIQKQIYDDYSEYWDWYAIESRRLSKGPIELDVSGQRLHGGEVEDTMRNHYAVNIIESSNEQLLELNVPTTLPLHAGDDTCFTFLSSQLRNCWRTHVKCNHFNDTRLPTRVIRVDDTETKLYDTNGATGQYAILSYCWGKDGQVLKTTQSNLESYLCSLPIDQLPTTISDAIKVARRLSIRYLWVDSLCILQDSKSDWEAESARMCEYYRNSSLTIAASAGLHADSGILVSRTDLSAPFELAVRSANGIACRALVQKERPLLEELAKPIREFGPLSSRGWTFQESAVSTRIIHYTSTGMVWDCSEHTSFERGQIISHTPTSFSNELASNVLSSHLWLQLVESYSARYLSFSKDRLPAFSGIAKLYSLNGYSKYLAGLWEQDLLRQLSWKTNWSLIEDPDGNPHHVQLQRNCPNRLSGPSWSWASTDGPILFAKVDIEQQEVAPVSYTKIQGANCTVEGANPFGKVPSGIINLHGPFVEISSFAESVYDIGRYLVKTPPSLRERLPQLPAGNWGSDRPEIWIDIRPEATRESLPTMVHERLWCIRLFKDIALVLVKSSERDDSYVRIGLCEKAGILFENAETKRIAIF